VPIVAVTASADADLSPVTPEEELE